MRDALFDGQCAPGQIFRLLGATLGLIGHFQQPLGGIGPASQHHIFHPLAQVERNVFVRNELTGIHDAHIHAGTDGMIQEHCVHRFAQRIVAAEREAHVAYAAGDLGER